MSGVQPFQFEPTYPPGEEPVDSEEETGDEGDSGANFDNSWKHRMVHLWGQLCPNVDGR